MELRDRETPNRNEAVQERNNKFGNDQQNVEKAQRGIEGAVKNNIDKDCIKKNYLKNLQQLPKVKLQS